MKNNIDIGTNIRAARRERRMLQKDLAERAGISVRCLLCLEKNKWSPTLDTLILLADALDVPAADLLRQVEADGV